MRLNLPADFLNRMRTMLGEEYEAFQKSYEEERQYGLRVNTRKISCEEFESICPFPIKKIPWVPNGYFYPSEVRPSLHPYYRAGLYYLQEPSAMPASHSRRGSSGPMRGAWRKSHGIGHKTGRPRNPSCK